VGVQRRPWDKNPLMKIGRAADNRIR
jgi:hypothetical protein